MKNIMKICTVIAAVFLLQACQGPVATNEEGEALAVKYLTAMNEERYEDAFALVSKDFFNTRSKEERLTYHKQVQETMGPVVSVKLADHLVDNRFSGRFYMFKFAVRHENGISMEMITMIEKINSKDPLTIAGHKIESSKLKKLNANF